MTMNEFIILEYIWIEAKIRIRIYIIYYYYGSQSLLKKEMFLRARVNQLTPSTQTTSSRFI